MLVAMTNVSRFGSLPVSALSGDRVACVAPEATLHEVAEAMTVADVGSLLVGDLAEPTGIVTERDLVGALAERRDPGTTRAGDVAHRQLIRCSADATVAEVADLMMQRYVRHVLVEDDTGLVGIVSARDLLGVYAAGDVALDDEDADDVVDDDLDA